VKIIKLARLECPTSMLGKMKNRLLIGDIDEKVKS